MRLPNAILSTEKSKKNCLKVTFVLVLLVCIGKAQTFLLHLLVSFFIPPTLPCLSLNRSLGMMSELSFHPNELVIGCSVVC